MVIIQMGPGVVPDPWSVKTIDGAPRKGEIITDGGYTYEVAEVRWVQSYPVLGRATLEAHVRVRRLPTPEGIADQEAWEQRCQMGGGR